MNLKWVLTVLIGIIYLSGASYGAIDFVSSTASSVELFMTAEQQDSESRSPVVRIFTTAKGLSGTAKRR